MPREKSISFRSHLIASSVDLIKGVGWHCSRTSELIASIVSQLAAYTEEGVPMTPSVFICDSISDLLRRAGVGEYLSLSNDVPLERAGPRILKATAPLCETGWRVYVERLKDGENCRYGIFSGSNDPSSLTIDEVVLDRDQEGFPIVRIAQSAVNKVEVRTNTGDSTEFRFNDDSDVEILPARRNIVALSRVIARDGGPLTDQFASYIERVLTQGIRDSHGTLIAVVPAGQEAIPMALRDLVLLGPPVDLYERFSRHIQEKQSATSVGRLQLASELVSGFISSDGVTIFASSGRVMAYRAFVQIESISKPSGGGARSRAFSALNNLVGSQLIAAYFRSQDGRSDFVQCMTTEKSNA